MPATTKKLRCAVYTRKSTDEGLDKEFNTLDAQREACEAYVASQRAEDGPWSATATTTALLRRHPGASRAEAAVGRYRAGPGRRHRVYISTGCPAR